MIARSKGNIRWSLLRRFTMKLLSLRLISYARFSLEWILIHPCQNLKIFKLTECLTFNFLKTWCLDGDFALPPILYKLGCLLSTSLFCKFLLSFTMCQSLNSIKKLRKKCSTMIPLYLLKNVLEMYARWGDMGTSPKMKIFFQLAGNCSYEFGWLGCC